MMDSMGFMNRFKEKSQYLKKGGVVALGVHVVKKKETPNDSENKEKVKLSPSLANIKLPPIRQARRLYMDNDLNDIQLGNKKYHKRTGQSVDSLHQNHSVEEEANRKKLKGQKSVIMS